MINETEFIRRLQSDFEAFKNQNTVPNVLIVGGTGTGKSSLINRCFHSNLAQSGTGKPVTQQLRRYQQDNLPVVIYDTQGYEISEDVSEKFIATIMQYFDGKGTDGNYINVAWYCIQASGHRVTDFDLNVIQKIKSCHIPVAVVLTKSDLVSEEDVQKMRAVVAEKWHIPFFKTSSIDKFFDKEIENLCRWTIDSLPEGMRTAFIAAQRDGLKRKREESEKLIKQHVTAACGVAFSPIPFSDAPLLISNQAGMIARIIYVYGLQNVIKMDSQALFSVFIGPVISRAAVSTAGSLLKLIPGFGTLIGGVINAGVATAVTWAIGRATIRFCEYVIEGDLEKAIGNIGKNMDMLSEVYETFLKEEVQKK